MHEQRSCVWVWRNNSCTTYSNRMESVLYQSFQFLRRLIHPRWGRPDFLHQHASVRQVVYLIVLLQVWQHWSNNTTPMRSINLAVNHSLNLQLWMAVISNHIFSSTVYVLKSKTVTVFSWRVAQQLSEKGASNGTEIIRFYVEWIQPIYSWWCVINQNITDIWR